MKGNWEKIVKKSMASFSFFKVPFLTLMFLVLFLLISHPYETMANGNPQDLLGHLLPKVSSKPHRKIFHGFHHKEHIEKCKHPIKCHTRKCEHTPKCKKHIGKLWEVSIQMYTHCFPFSSIHHYYFKFWGKTIYMYCLGCLRCVWI